MRSFSSPTKNCPLFPFDWAVEYALGGNSGGLTLFMDNGQLIYEYNMLLVERYRSNSPQRIPAGKHRIEVQTQVAKPGAPATVIIRVD